MFVTTHRQARQDISFFRVLVTMALLLIYGNFSAIEKIRAVPEMFASPPGTAASFFIIL